MGQEQLIQAIEHLLEELEFQKISDTHEYNRQDIKRGAWEQRLTETDQMIHQWKDRLMELQSGSPTRVIDEWSVELYKVQEQLDVKQEDTNIDLTAEKNSTQAKDNGYSQQDDFSLCLSNLTTNELYGLFKVLTVNKHRVLPQNQSKDALIREILPIIDTDRDALRRVKMFAEAFELSDILSFV